MWLTTLYVALVFAVRSFVVAAIPNCPYNGPSFPLPADFASSEIMQTALGELTEAFEGLKSDPSVNPNWTSWSVQIFSTTDEDKPLWEHYHTAPLLNLSPAGVQEVDGDTIYRLGSNTKIFTMLTFLAEAGEQYLNDPITKWVPELADLAGKAAEDPVMNVDWDGITIGAIASHMAGIVRDCGLHAYFTYRWIVKILIVRLTSWRVDAGAGTYRCIETLSWGLMTSLLKVL